MNYRRGFASRVGNPDCPEPAIHGMNYKVAGFDVLVSDLFFCISETIGSSVGTKSYLSIAESSYNPVAGSRMSTFWNQDIL